MSMLAMAIPFHEGETRMHKLLKLPGRDNPTAGMLTQQATSMLQRAPLLAIGTLDAEEYPWTSLWGGDPGFSEPLGSSIIGTRTPVDGSWDPVVRAVVGSAEKGRMVKGNDKMVSGLSFDLMTRKRVKLFGRVIGGSVDEMEVDPESDKSTSTKQTQIQLITKVEQSLGNCPKYMNQYEVKPERVNSHLAYQGSHLSPEAKSLILGSDMFFLSSSTVQDMDTNIRGGPSGFVRVLSDMEIAYPEYSGNRLYQSLGNLKVNPRIGLTFPNYETGDVLYTTGTSQILIGSDAAALLPGSNLALKIKLHHVRLVTGGLPFRGTRKEPSPYNPLVRTLASEGNLKSSLVSSRKSVQLVGKTVLAPTVARFTFSAADNVDYEPGQWAAFDFSEQLDIGYSHMRNDDPRSLNDDFVRTFTISSAPSANRHKSEFDITIRNVGTVTNYLFQQNEHADFEVPMVGIGGDFKIDQAKNRQKLTPFIAGGGVGITPLLGQLGQLELSPSRFKLLWTMRIGDVGLALDVFKNNPELAECTIIFFTGSSAAAETEDPAAQLVKLGAIIERRRISRADIDAVESETWYLCAGNPLRKNLLLWLEGKTVVFENFDY